MPGVAAADSHNAAEVVVVAGSRILLGLAGIRNSFGGSVADSIQHIVAGAAGRRIRRCKLRQGIPTL